jgi:hypothetical protein
LRSKERRPTFGWFQDSAFDDLDFEIMFDQAWDGYAEESSLRFEYWFSAFQGDQPMHPYFRV